MLPKKFVILNNKDLALTTGSTGLTKIGFTESSRNTEVISGSTVKLPTVSFQTTNPCVAVIDPDNIQWDLNSKRVWYTSTTCTIDLSDVLYAKGLVDTPAKIISFWGYFLFRYFIQLMISLLSLTPKVIYLPSLSPAVLLSINNKL